MSNYGYGVTPTLLERLVHDIVVGRAPDKAPLLAKVASRSLSGSEREELRGILVNEFVEAGLGPDDEPNDRGHLVEAAIRWLGHLQ